MVRWSDGKRDVSSTGCHMEEKRQLIYGMKYGMAAKPFSDMQIQTDE